MRSIMFAEHGSEVARHGYESAASRLDSRGSGRIRGPAQASFNETASEGVLLSWHSTRVLLISSNAPKARFWTLIFQ